jgi:hypothetical protein
VASKEAESHPGTHFQIISWHDIHQEVKDVRLRDGSCDVVPLQRPPLVLLRVDPRAQRELQNEHLARLGKEHRGFCTDHLHGEGDALPIVRQKHRPGARKRLHRQRWSPAVWVAS